MNISKETIAIMLTIAIAVGGGAWTIGNKIGELTERVTRLEVGQQVLATEIKINRLHNAHHRHHTTGEVYYERDIARGASANAGTNASASNTASTSTRDIASADDETDATEPRE